MSAKKEESKKSLIEKQYGNAPKGFDPASWIALIGQFSTFLPVVKVFVESVLDLFKKKGLKATDMGDCCPYAKECVESMVAAVTKKTELLNKMATDPCSEDLCKAYQQANAEEFAAFLCLHSCHE